MPGTAEGARKATAARLQQRAMMKGADRLPLDQLNVASPTSNVADVENTEQTKPQQHQTVTGLHPLLPIAAQTVGRAMLNGKSPWSVRLQAAVYVLGSCGIGPNQSGKSAPDLGDPAGRISGDVAAFLEAGARAVALRKAAAQAQDAEIVSERRGPVTLDQKTEVNQK